ncbi:MAG: 3-deoxy-manno-octulosonate cytidylyltransferase [Alphaproteobacteria bacterium]|nr:3-deoxy-manno-octulosonate cytidylyltransferase [Alphaproteobacteria bacterium]MCZ6840240.1 3-deoxy-manno-octulosonate cytidylyltransferase [Alphaproteobacteria bacterium]
MTDTDSSRRSPPQNPPKNPVVVIPARMASTRLPGKPLADIAGQPMIVHCWRRAVEADVGPVIVACAEPEIATAIESAGGTAVLTAPDLPSGSDRAAAALAAVDPDQTYDAVVNLQGDLPTLDPALVRTAFAALSTAGVDIATLACPITQDDERSNPNVVKAVIALEPGATQGRALYFSRAKVPAGDGDHYHHIGLYAFRRAALTRFVTLQESGLEQRERLEQLRALEAGMRIDVALVDTVPLGVDTPADLERARALLG